DNNLTDTVALSAAINALKEDIKKVESEVIDKAQKSERSFKDIVDQKGGEILSNVKKETDNVKSSILSSISLFVGFFAFLSVNVTVYSKVDTVYQAFILLFSSLLCILFFVYGTIFVVKHENILSGLNKAIIICVLVVSLIFSICNLFYSSFIRNEAQKLYSDKVDFIWHGKVPDESYFSCCEK
ncbi:TPA: hypothetical protein RQN60_004317, partial [Aeromonas dhakensis]|nr:hypothetical protein [Aeromonas dhakensis]